MNGPEDAGDTGLDLDSGTGGDVGADTRDLGFDIDSSVDAVHKDMGREGRDTTGRFETKDKQQAPTEAQIIQELAPPKSWAADKHALWKTLPRDAQEYYNKREGEFLTGLEQYKGDAGFARQFREVLNPYQASLRARGINETDAIRFLLNADHKLTQGSPEERRAFYQQLGRDLGFTDEQSAQSGEQQVTDPLVKQLQSQVSQIQSALSAESRQRETQARTKADAEVKAFATDKTNLYFDEVSPDMVGFINQGFDLKTAYEKAVWGNPVTRAKELARIQTEAAANKASTEQVDAAKRATSVNTRGTETQRTPTETKGKFLSDDSLREDLRKIRARG